MAQEALYNLEEVKKFVADCYFSNHNKASKAVMAVFRLHGSPKTHEEAEEFIRQQILLLEEKDFAKRSSIYHTCVADVYGKVINGHSWYIKFWIDEDKEDEGKWLEEISFHPPSENLTLQSGVLIKEGDMIYEQKTKMWRVR